MLGVYSFAVFVADGFLQIFYVFRTNINPIITKLFYNKPRNVLQRVIKKSIQKFYKIFLVFGALIAFIYPITLYLFNIDNYISLNFTVFYILLSGILIASGFIPYQFIFNQVGKPKSQSNFLVKIFLFSLILNLIFIPFLGIIGAAISVFITNVFQMLYLRNFIKHKLI